jgi:hypothetical protein
MKPACMLVRSFAPSTAESALPERLGRHASRCLACQAELARYSKLRRRLAAMAMAVETAPQMLQRNVAMAIQEPTDSPASSNRRMHLGRAAAAAGAVAAATAGAVAVWRQSKGIV